MDFFCFASLPVAIQLNIPGYFFFTSGAGILAIFLRLPTLHQNSTKSFKDLNSFLHVPGLPPLLSSDLPLPLIDRYDKSHGYFVDMATCFQKSAGIIVNTFELLEPRAFKAISDGLCIPSSTTPPVHCIGPLIATKSTSDGAKDQCLTWLDSQPSQSVIFLCFGSLGLFSTEQLREIAIGLERSGQRFLWVVRNPPSNNQSLAISAQPDPDLNSLLPDGFLDRTKDRGRVAKSWAPQVAVLNHNSETENGFVTALEVERRVNELMQSESGNFARKRTIAMKNEAKAALSEAESKCYLSVFWKLGAVLKGTVKRNSYWVGEKWPKILVGKGLVVKLWAPQVAVLNHNSVGGFVTHCGWNSVLEAVCAGVPMVAWPLYAEQRINRVLLVEEMKIALPMESENGFVTALEVEKRVIELMESESGKSVRSEQLL
ncbi:hypothetical protein GH714_018005 [Hevea brasiliensis]|uniref:Glycosyltransferase n=1 Tax=Hevea brasiliensis TaxID=3981 RepID=A0A6A6N498_HEVBR|nr:hypothetical protein GH714_018005 [Hevea brasiliensis]